MFFANIKQLLPGQYFLLRESGLETNYYYSLSDQINPNVGMTDIQAKSEFKKQLTQSVSYRVQSDVPVGLYFSGGVDSTAVAIGIKHAFPDKKIQSYTAISKNVVQSEKDIIKSMSDSLGLENKQVKSEFKNSKLLLIKTMWHMETPFSPSIFLDHVLNKEAKNDGITVVIEGQGADESQTGYLHYYIPHLVDCIKSKNWKRAYIIFKYRPKQLKKKYFLILVREFFRYSKLYNLFKIKSKPLINSLLSQKLKDIYSNKTTTQPIKKVTDSHLTNFQYNDYKSKLIRVLRVKDRISMAYSRELRVPFLDHNLVNFMFKVPNDLKIVKGRQKNILITSLIDDLPKSTYSYSKNDLLREKLNSDIHKKLLKNSLEYLSTEKARERGLFHSSVYTDSNLMDKKRTGIYWKLSQIELLHQVFFDKEITYPLSFLDEI